MALDLTSLLREDEIAPRRFRTAHLCHFEILQCQACSLHLYHRKLRVPGCGPLNAPLMIVGGGPSADEAAVGLPFVGAAGEMLSALLQPFVDRNSVFLTHVTHCHVLGGAAPTSKEIAACISHLDRQISAVNPYVIVTLGETAARAVTGDQTTQFSAMCGTVTRSAGLAFADSMPVVPTLHPKKLLGDGADKEMAFVVARAHIELAYNLCVQRATESDDDDNA